ncbi:MAG: double-strand break repair helicase AddA [Pseudomonadota bacterium]
MKAEKYGNQQAAANPKLSVWVRANAGTGKTHVLMNRVLRLLLDGAPPSKILCLTFTKAAAAEMAQRIYKELGAWTRLDDKTLAEKLDALRGKAPSAEDLSKARQLFAHALDVPGGLKLQTIHGFCESLLARFPVEAGVVPHFTVADERAAAELLREARERVFLAAGKAAGSALAAALQEVTAQVAEGKFLTVLEALVGERGKLRRGLARYGGANGLARVVRERLGLGPDEDRSAILGAAAQDKAFDGKALRRVARGLSEGSVTDQARGAKLAAWLGASAAERKEGFDAYLEVFFIGGGKGKRRAELAYTATLERCPDAIEILAAEADRLDALREKLKALAMARASQALVGIGKALLEAYEDLKRQAALLDYDDLIFEARRLLEREGIAPWVLYKLDGGIDHILVDEAQDTNPDQWRVIAALASEFFTGAGARENLRTVFAVGDVKQSIFGFQRADPEAFAAMRDHFAARVQAADEQWRDVPLELSFRSAPAILQAVDAVFCRDDARDGVAFGVARIQHKPERQGQAGRVELWPPEREEKPAPEKPWTLPLEQLSADAPESRLAKKIAAQIRTWLDTGERLPSRDRAIRPGDILILVRRRHSFFEELVRTLKEHDIPVAGLDRMVLTRQLAVRDLIAFGHFVLLPEDDLTLATVLKSPLVGLDEDALFELAHGRQGTLWEALCACRAKCEKFASAHALLAAWLAKADFVPPFEFFASLLGPSGARTRLVARLGREANDPMDEFLSLALAYEKLHAPSLEGFLHWLAAGKSEIKRDLERGRDEVRVMTVHGAKGLEAPIVFLPDTCQMPRPQEDNPLLWLEGDVLLWPPRREHEVGAARAARAAQARRRDQEYHRLLYVAMTRAEDRLYIGGWEKKAAGCWYDLIRQGLEGIAKPVTLVGGEEGLRLETPQKRQPKAKAEAAETTISVVSGLPDWARKAPRPEPARVRTLSPSRAALSEPPVRSPVGADEGLRFRRGRLVHRLLQFLPGLPQADRPAALRRYLSQPALALREAAGADIAAEVMAVLEAGDFAPIFGRGSRAEVPIVGEVNGQVIAGQVDRLLVTDDLILVVDYKTQRTPPETAAETPEIYLRQMAAYTGLLAKIYPGRRVRAALLWTDGPKLVPLKEEWLRPYAP